MGSKMGGNSFHFFFGNRGAKKVCENDRGNDLVYEDNECEQLEYVDEDEFVDLDKHSKKIKLEKFNVISNENNYSNSAKKVLAAKRVQAVRNLKRRILIGF